MNRNEKLNKLIKISLLGAIGFLLMFIEFAVPIFPSFLKFDISDLPALIGAFAMGPVAGVIIELLKNILHGIFASKTLFVGELANFLVGGVFVFVAGYYYKINRTKKGAIIGLALGTLVMTLAAGVFNYFIFLPLYEKVLNFPIKAIVGMGAKINPSIKDLNTFIVLSIMPFNLIKGIIVSILTRLTYKSVAAALGEKLEAKVKAY